VNNIFDLGTVEINTNNNNNVSDEKLKVSGTFNTEVRIMISGPSPDKNS
jgi:hypothetical protein